MFDIIGPAGPLMYPDQYFVTAETTAGDGRTLMVERLR